MLTIAFNFLFAFLILFMAVSKCNDGDSNSLKIDASVPEIESKENQIEEIKGYKFFSKKVDYFKLDYSLQEISGLSLTRDGRLLGHNDELGIIFEVDYKTGKEVKRFYLGKPIIRQDIEGIARKGDTLFVVNSKGVIYRLMEGKKDEHIQYDKFKTHLSQKYDVEGLAYDPIENCLLLACKGYPGKGLKGQKAVYSFSLKSYKVASIPRFILPIKEITNTSGRKEFNPSAIEVHPVTGNFFILAANDQTIIEITPDGDIIGVSKLRKSVNIQPEGLAILEDGTVLIANEGKKDYARLVIYPEAKKETKQN